MQTERLNYISIHHAAPSRACKTFAIIFTGEEMIPVSEREHNEWLAIQFMPPIKRQIEGKRFIEKILKNT